MNRIYGNIQYKPRIWGLYFSSLFTTLGVFLITLMVLSTLTGTFNALFFSFISFVVVGGYYYYKDNRDEVEYQAKRTNVLKGRITSYSISEQKIKFIN